MATAGRSARWVSHATRWRRRHEWRPDARTTSSARAHDTAFFLANRVVAGGALAGAGDALPKDALVLGPALPLAADLLPGRVQVLRDHEAVEQAHDDRLALLTRQLFLL